MTTNTELIAQLKALGIPDWATARWLMTKAADAIEALEATNSANMATCKGIIQGLQAERDALQDKLAAEQGQEPDIYVHNDGLEVWGAKTNPEYASDPNFKAYYAAPIPQQPAQQPAQQVNAMLVEALGQAEKLEHEALVALSEATYELKVGNPYTTATDTYKANNDLIHRLDKILNLQYRDRKHAALTAAKQAQPEPDCRTCEHFNSDMRDDAGLLYCERAELQTKPCANGDQYQPAPSVVLWRAE